MSLMQVMPSAGLFPSFLSVTLFLVLTQRVEVRSAAHVFICLLVCELSASLPDILILGKIFTDFKHISFKLSTTTISRDTPPPPPKKTPKTPQKKPQ